MPRGSSRGRSPRRRSIAIVLAACSLASVVGAPAATTATATPALPADGVLFGAHVPVHPRTGPTRSEAIAAFEALTGHPAAIDRQYYFWDQAWPTADDELSRDAGRLPFLSWNARRSDRTFASWSSIAAGGHDALIDARAADVAAFGAPVIVSFNHEPENDAEAGTPAEYVAAFRRIRARFEAAGATNAIFAWTVMAWSFRRGTAAAFYPGDDVVDVIAGDGYNWYGCPNPTGPWRSFTEVFSAWHAWGSARGKPMIVAEWGSSEDPTVPGRKATWIDLAATQLKLWPDVVGVSYFHHDRGCARWVDSSPSSLEAYRAMGADPAFSTSPAITITSGPAVQTTSRTASFTVTTPGAAGIRCRLDGASVTSCDAGSVTYRSLPVGVHRFETFAVDASGAPTTGIARWTWSVAPGTPVTVQDFSFKPATKYPRFGDTVLFAFVGPSEHSVRDATGLGLFDTGVQPPGPVLPVEVPSAGTFPFACAVHPAMKGSLKAGVQLSPTTGAPATAFTIRWALGPPPIGDAYDVQVQRPGSTKWKMLLNDTSLASTTFVPDAGTGTYRFRARLQRLAGGASGYSGAAAISVT